MCKSVTLGKVLLWSMLPQVVFCSILYRNVGLGVVNTVVPLSKTIFSCMARNFETPQARDTTVEVIGVKRNFISIKETL